MNGSSSDDGDSDRRSSKYIFRIGKTDRFAWEQVIMPKLNARYTDAPGGDPVAGAAAIKRKALILPYVEGTRVRDAQAMAEKAGDDMVPYLDVDGSIKKKSWDACTTREIVQGIGLLYEKNDDGREKKKAFYNQNFFDPDKEEVEDLNERFELKLLAAVAILDEDDNEVREAYVDMFERDEWIANWLQAKLYTVDGDTLSKLFDEALLAQKSRPRRRPRREEKPAAPARRGRGLAAAASRRFKDEGDARQYYEADEPYDTVAAAVEQGSAAANILREMAQQKSLLETMTDMLLESQKELRSIKAEVQALRKEAKERGDSAAPAEAVTPANSLPPSQSPFPSSSRFSGSRFSGGKGGYGKGGKGWKGGGYQQRSSYGQDSAYAQQTQANPNDWRC